MCLDPEAQMEVKRSNLDPNSAAHSELDKIGTFAYFRTSLGLLPKIYVE